ncbi:MAG: hypothetical protein ACKOBC_12370 [Hyphomicrobiales bacterium]
MLDRTEKPEAPKPQPPLQLDRRPCCIVSELLLDEEDLVLDGIVRWLLPDRALFREASRYILERRNDRVRLRILGEDHPAKIIGTTREGYEIAFETEIPRETVVEWVDRYLTEE